MKISIIVPVYKAENTIKDCVKSILAQTFDDFELILVDDGSPDKSGSICDELKTIDSRIRVYHQENQGVSVARNKGLEVAEGDFVMFCDSDDYVHRKWCEVLYDTAIQFPNSCITCDIERVRKTDKILEEADVENCGKPYQITYYEMYQNGLSSYCPAKIFNRAVIEKNEIRFPEGVAISEDLRFVAKYIDCCENIVYIPQKLNYYVFNNEDSALHSFHESLFEWDLQAFGSRAHLVEEKYLPEYCDKNLYAFINAFDYIFDKRCKKSFWYKMRYNQRMLNSDEFQFCLKHATCKNEDKRYIALLKKKNYYLVWLYTKMLKLANKLKGSR